MLWKKRMQKYIASSLFYRKVRFFATAFCVCLSVSLVAFKPIYQRDLAGRERHRGRGVSTGFTSSRNAMCCLSPKAVS